MSRNGIVVITSIVITFFLLLAMASTNFNHIEDTNGELTDLVTIHLNEVAASESYSSMEFMSSYTYSGDTTGITYDYEQWDHDYLRHSANKISGVKVIQATKVASSDRLLIDISSEIDNGNFEIVIISPQKEVIRSILINTFQRVSIDTPMAGIYLVVIGAESAKYRIEVERHIQTS